MARPRFVLASIAVDAPVPPSAIARSVIPVMVPPLIFKAVESWVAILPRPRFIRASSGFEAPVPPSATVRSVIPVMVPPTILIAVES